MEVHIGERLRRCARDQNDQGRVRARSPVQHDDADGGHRADARRQLSVFGDAVRVGVPIVRRRRDHRQQRHDDRGGADRRGRRCLRHRGAVRKLGLRAPQMPGPVQVAAPPGGQRRHAGRAGVGRLPSGPRGPASQPARHHTLVHPRRVRRAVPRHAGARTGVHRRRSGDDLRGRYREPGSHAAPHRGTIRSPSSHRRSRTRYCTTPSGTARRPSATPWAPPPTSFIPTSRPPSR